MLLKSKLAVLLAAVGVVACLTGKPAAAQHRKIAFIPGVIGDVFYTSMQCGLAAEARARGVDVSVEGSQRFDPSLQKPVLDSVIATHPDAIIIAPTDAVAMRRPLEQALKAGIKVILVDTVLTNAEGISSQIASDNVLGGKTAFQAFEEVSPKGGKVLLIGNQPGVSTTDQRVDGFKSAVQAAKTISVADVQYNNNDSAQAAQIVSSELQKTPDLAGVFAATQPAATGAATGIRQNQKQGSVKLVAFDASPDEVRALKAGAIQALVAQEPAKMGKIAIDQALAAIAGQANQAMVKTGFIVITQKNLNDHASAVYQTACQ